MNSEVDSNMFVDPHCCRKLLLLHAFPAACSIPQFQVVPRMVSHAKPCVQKNTETPGFQRVQLSFTHFPISLQGNTDNTKGRRLENRVLSPKDAESKTGLHQKPSDEWESRLRFGLHYTETRVSWIRVLGLKSTDGFWWGAAGCGAAALGTKLTLMRRDRSVHRWTVESSTCVSQSTTRSPRQSDAKRANLSA